MSSMLTQDKRFYYPFARALCVLSDQGDKVDQLMDYQKSPQQREQLIVLFNQVVKQWKATGDVCLCQFEGNNGYDISLSKKLLLETNDKPNGYCICGSRIKENCLITRDSDQQSVWIGNCCVGRFDQERSDSNKKVFNNLISLKSSTITQRETKKVNINTVKTFLDKKVLTSSEASFLLEIGQKHGSPKQCEYKLCLMERILNAGFVTAPKKPRYTEESIKQWKEAGCIRDQDAIFLKQINMTSNGSLTPKQLEYKESLKKKIIEYNQAITMASH